MAIKSNRKIDFEYEFEAPSGSYSILLRFYHTEEYGPTIGVLGEDGEPAINFPVTMFSEVSDHLAEQGILEARRSNSQSNQVPYAKLPKTVSVPNKPSLSLPKPKLISGKSSFVNPLKINKNERNVVEVDLENDDGEAVDEASKIESILKQEKDRLDSIHASVDGAIPAQSLSNSVEQSELSDEELEQILKERQSASNRAKNADRAIRKKHE